LTISRPQYSVHYANHIYDLQFDLQAGVD